MPDFLQAISLEPDTPHYHSNLGPSLWHLERCPESAQAYSEVIRLAPNEPGEHSDRADVDEAVGRDDLAVADRAKAQRLKKKG